MRLQRKHICLATVGTAALALSIPVLGQNSPESLLPPGFGDPAPAPAPPPSPSAAPTPAPGPVVNRPAASPGASSPTPSSSASNVPSINDPDFVPDVALRPPTSSLDLSGDDGLSELDDAFQRKYYLPAGQRRSLKQIGVLTERYGGISADGFGQEGGKYLTNLIKNLDGPIVSRWGSILLRRVLLSKVDSPSNVKPADWVAERAWRLLLVGEADAARALVSKVDGGNFSPRLYEVAMQSHLATSDPAGVCPYVAGGSEASEAPTWSMFKPICASFSGEQSQATRLLRSAQRKKVASGIDYLLAEKTIGAGFKGRRAVAIKWDDIQYFNNWRYGLGTATGVEPPDRLYAKAGRHVQGWRARAPMLSLDSRMKASDIATAMGVLSNRAMVDLYAAAYDDPDVTDDLKARTSILRQAYTGASASSRIGAMKSLWNRSNGAMASYSAKVLTARAAAKIPASEELSEDSDALVASMMSAGLDRSAARWVGQVPSGSLAWGLLAVGAPDGSLTVEYGSLDDFADADTSASQLKSKFLLAALAGLGRLDDETQQDFISDLDLDLTQKSRWTEAIRSAAQRGQSGTVALLTAVGMQGRSWNAMSPLHLYHITRALKRVGMEAEARMIAAEALTRTI